MTKNFLVISFLQTTVHMFLPLAISIRYYISDFVFIDNKVPTSEGPVCGNTSVKEPSLREVIQNMAGKNVFDPHLHTSKIMTPREGESSEPAKQSKKHMQLPGEETVVDKEEQCSAPSFGSIKDSDCDNSDNRNGKVS